MNRALPLALCLALGGCTALGGAAEDRAAVHAEEARLDSLSAIPADSLTAAERAERDRLAAGAVERAERLREAERREGRHRAEVLVAVLGAALAAGAVGAFVLLVSAE